jgi:hypothetical protein
MTQEEKQLLLKDLCARLPYGVYVLVHDTFKYSTVPYENVYLKSSGISSLIDSISLNERYNSKDKLFNRIIKEHKDFLEFKPYLRPMSSMTEEETKYKLSKFFKVINTNIEGIGYIPTLNSDSAIEYVNWLIENHFDYHGLIPIGLALEAKEGMYEMNNE